MNRGHLFSIVVPVLDGGESFVVCLRALSASSFVDYELIVVDDGSTDGSQQVARDHGAMLLETDGHRGPAAARNQGAREATGEYLLFIDADCEVQSDTVEKMAQHFEADPRLDALFGSYDDDPAVATMISRFSNLLHHYVHQTAATDAETFWAGCGAIRRLTFADLGGFDSERYPHPSVEDIELGYRLKAAGGRILLAKEVRVKHHKRWTLASMVRSDVLDRGLPWTHLILQRRRKARELNIDSTGRASVALIGVGGLCSLAAAVTPIASLGALWAAATLIFVHRRFYGFLRRRHGLAFCAASILLHVIHLAASGLAYSVGWMQHLLRRKPDEEESFHTLHTNESDRSILKRYFVLGGAHVVGSGLGFLSVLVVIHHFGAGGFGMLQLATTLLTYGMVVTLWGTHLHAVRTSAGDRDQMESLVGSVVLLRLMLGVGAYLILLVLAQVVPQFRDVRLLVMILGVGLISGALTLRWVPQALHRTQILARVELESQALWLASLVIALRFVPELWVVAVTRVGADAFAACRLWLWITLRGGMAPRFPSWRDVRRLLKGSAPIGGTQLLRALALSSDLLLLGLLVSREELGHYAAAFRIFGLLMVLSNSYFVILLPRLAEYARRPGRGLALEVGASFRRILPLAITGSMALIILASPVLRTLFGESFAEATWSLRIMAVVVIVNIVRHHYRQVLLTTGRQTPDMRQTAASGVVHLGSKLALIPWLGITGAAAGTLAGELFLLALQWSATRADLAKA